VQQMPRKPVQPSRMEGMRRVRATRTRLDRGGTGGGRFDAGGAGSGGAGGAGHGPDGMAGDRTEADARTYADVQSEDGGPLDASPSDPAPGGDDSGCTIRQRVRGTSDTARMALALALLGYLGRRRAPGERFSSCAGRPNASRRTKSRPF